MGKQKQRERKKNFEKANPSGWKQLSKYHWRREYNGYTIDYWPSTKRFKVLGGPTRFGDPMKYAAENLDVPPTAGERKPSGMFVTIMSDASFCHRTSSSGWGVWMKSARGAFDGGGNFKTEPKCPTEAEAMAASVALYTALKNGIAQRGDNIILQVDAMNVIQAFTGQYRKKKKVIQCCEYLRKLAEEHELYLEMRHVKAHAPELAGRNWCNDQCDKHAKTYMRKMREMKNDGRTSEGALA